MLVISRVRLIFCIFKEIFNDYKSYIDGKECHDRKVWDSVSAIKGVTKLTSGS